MLNYHKLNGKLKLSTKIIKNVEKDFFLITENLKKFICFLFAFLQSNYLKRKNTFLKRKYLQSWEKVFTVAQIS